MIKLYKKLLEDAIQLIATMERDSQENQGVTGAPTPTANSFKDRLQQLEKDSTGYTTIPAPQFKRGYEFNHPYLGSCSVVSVNQINYTYVYLVSHPWKGGRYTSNLYEKHITQEEIS